VFPACLPPPTPALAGRVVAWRAAEAQAAVEAAAVGDALEELHAAITEGLDRKEQAREQ
jgi:hypothetical protein